MAVYRIEVAPRDPQQAEIEGRGITATLREAGLAGVQAARAARLYFVEGTLVRRDAERIARQLLADPITQTSTVLGTDDPPPTCTADCAVEVHPRPGVMDPVALSTLAELQAEGLPVESVRTARRYELRGAITRHAAAEHVGRALANDCIEQVVVDTAGVQPAPRPPEFAFTVRHVPLRALDDAALDALSREAHLFLSRSEMRVIQAHYRSLEREPTDVELETLAQTWSEHCVHKTLRSAIVYRGRHLPNPHGEETLPPACGEVTLRYDNLLRDTIARATDELIRAGRGPRCLSVFKDNAGVIRFDDTFGLAFKVETHNHPSAIEPYGGAATGIGGVIRDVIGCGLGAKPIANTDVFCVAPSDWPQEALPKGVLHPGRVLRGIVRGVADYGNRMGIPTVNGAVYFDPRYLGNPLVFCGCVGLMPHHMVAKAARPGDLVVVIGGRTGRDGIHGATFSSAELTDSHADEFSHAVQIGNAITEKRFLDAVLQARDAAGGCLYSAITDCGAGGLSSAVGEMGEHTGAVVDLEKVPLKYAGLRYDEIWISEAQERMVLAVPPENLDRVLEIMRAEEVEATVIGVFGTEQGAIADPPRLRLRYAGHVVGELEMALLHDGLPRVERVAQWQPQHDAVAQARESAPPPVTLPAALAQVAQELSRPRAASKAWIIRSYDHEVQGGSVIKPLVGPGRGPADAAVLRPVASSWRGFALGCGLAPHLADVDPYWMAAAAIDEALRNVVCVGGDPHETAILDNFCWGRSDDAHQLGALVRACQACYDVAVAYGTPFISGKDSLNNEFALDGADVDRVLATLRARAAGDDADARWLRAILPVLEGRIRATGRLAIPATLLISALSIVPDVRRCQTPDLKAVGDDLLLVGGAPPSGFKLETTRAVHHAVADLIREGHVAACHDASDGGWLTAVAEMALCGRRGVRLVPDPGTTMDPLREVCAAYVIEVGERAEVERRLSERQVAHAHLGQVREDGVLECGSTRVAVAELAAAWTGGKA